MKSCRFFALGIALLLAGCGSLEVEVEYEAVPTFTVPEAPVVFESTPGPDSTASMTNTMPPAATGTSAGAPSAVAVSAGREHTCAVMASGGVKCWGSNDHGQLGNGTWIGSMVPVDVAGLSDAVEVTAGWKHTCARTAGGAVKCWGYNRNGELGDGKTSDSAIPVAVRGLESGVAAVEAGDDHTCAVTASGGVKCWGYNEYGQLGDGTTISRSVPVDGQAVAGGASAVAAGWGHTCVLSGDGGVRCWGNNQYGQLGYGQDADHRFTAVEVVGLARAVAALRADGGQSCALTVDGGIRCWGNNKYGQLGDGTAEVRNSPVPAAGLASGQRDAAVGWNHSCAVDSAGGLRCWGWNYYGQLGDGTRASRTGPSGVLGLPDGVRALGLGWAHTCAVTEYGAVYCWGANENGQLGDGTGIDSLVPIAAAGLNGTLRPPGTAPTRTATSAPPTATKTGPAPTGTPTAAFSPWSALFLIDISAGKDFTCVLSEESRIFCWGSGERGKLGNGSAADSPVPVEVDGLGGILIEKIEAGQSHACLLTDQGNMMCWGANDHGQLGNGATMDSPVPVKVSVIGERVYQMALGEDFTCVLLERGVKCWGGNAHGQLGNDTTSDSLTPVAPKGPFQHVRNISAGKFSACLEDSWGKVFCWGDNSSGQLGNGITLGSSIPVAVKGLGDVFGLLAVGTNHACAGEQSRGMQCWGSNSAGQLGDGTTTDRRTAVSVHLSEGIEILEAGDAITCIQTSSYKLACWGDHRSGVLGSPLCSSLGSFCSEPVYLPESLVSPAYFSLGNAHICMLSMYGDLFCWGANDHGQLGDGTKVNRTSPVPVVGIGTTAEPTVSPPAGLVMMTNTPTPSRVP